MARGIVSSPNEVVVRLDPLIDFEDRLVSGELAEDGVQYEYVVGELKLMHSHKELLQKVEQIGAKLGVGK